jgi:hypothetical protein
MATYEPLVKDLDPYQEGNESDLQLELEGNFPIDIVSDITFQVRDFKGNILISKRMVGGDIAITDDTAGGDPEGDAVKLVTIPIPPSDTRGKPGMHQYEVDFLNLNGNPFITVGGLFPVTHEKNTL